MKIITVTNQKGGVGKTTTSGALLAGLKKAGFKTLGIDLDPQTNFSYIAKADLAKPSAKDIFAGGAAAETTVQETPLGDFIAANKNLSNVAAELSSIDQVYKLSKSLKPIRERYDYIIIDTPPALSPLTINALMASTSVIIPVGADTFSLQGVQDLANTINPIREINEGLIIEGILIVMYKERTNLSKYMTAQFEKCAEILGTKVFSTKIRESIAIKESQLARESIFDYNINSTVALDYANFIKELLA